MIEIKHFEEEVIKLYDNNDNFIGEIDNELSFNDVRLQIAEQELSGYYVIRNNGDKVIIEENGQISDFNLYPDYSNILRRLVTILVS